jgi:ferredoxin-type protein NapF
LPPGLNVSIEACTHCESECVGACPENIIYEHPETHLYGFIPYLDFTVSGCTYCGECTKACPSTFHDQDAHNAIGKLNINLEKCLSLNGVFCMSCVGKCSFSALALDERRQLHYSMESCNGCGMCVGICPVNALKVQSISIEQYQKKQNDNPKNRKEDI